MGVMIPMVFLIVTVILLRSIDSSQRAFLQLQEHDLAVSDFKV